MPIVILYLIIAAVFQLIFGNTPTQGVFVFYSFLNVAIFIHFAWYAVKQKGKMGLLSPVLLASFYVFALSFGITDIPYISFGAKKEASNWMATYFGATKNSFFYTNPILFFSVIAHLSMWGGYYFPGLIQKLQKTFKNFTFFNRLTNKSQINVRAIILLYIISIGIKVFMFKLHIYGMTQDPDAALQYSNISSFLKALFPLGQVCLFLFAIYSFTEKKHYFFLFLMVIIEVVFGFLAAFKSQIGIPFIILAFCYFYVNGRINILYFVVIFFTVQLAYSTIEPFRQQKEQLSIVDYSFEDVYNTYRLAQANKQLLLENDRQASILVQASDRLNSTGIAGLAYRYYLTKGWIPEYRLPERITLLPAMLILPEGIWKNKPKNDFGPLTYKKILGGTLEGVSVGISPIGFTILGWDSVWIIIPIFIIVGIVEQFFAYIFYNYKLPGLIIYVANVASLYNVVELSFFLIALIRGFFIGLIVQYFYLIRKIKIYRIRIELDFKSWKQF